MSEATITYQGTCYPEDCDHMGHMNVAAYVKKFDHGTWMLWATVGFTRDVMDREDRGLAAMKSELSYLREVHPGDAIRVYSHFVTRSNRSAVFQHDMMLLAADGVETPAATCRYRVACLDRTARKAAPFPEDVAARVDAALVPDVEGEAV